MAVNEEIISQFEIILSDLLELSGAAENTRIDFNLEVVDASPSAPLTNYVIVSGGPGGTFNGPALKVPGLTYATGDKVNVIFKKGTEPVAMQQGSASSGTNAGLWIKVSGTDDIYYVAGNVSIGFDQTGGNLLHVVSQSGSDGARVDAYGGTAGLTLGSAGGTYGTPSGLASNGVLGDLDFYAYEGVTPGFVIGARLRVALDTALLGNEAPSMFRFYTWRIASGMLEEGFQVDANGFALVDSGYVFLSDDDTGVFNRGADALSLEAGSTIFVIAAEDTQDSLDFGTTSTDIDYTFFANGAAALTIEGSSGNATFGVNANAPAFGTPMTNSSGAAVIAGDIGYMDEAGVFKTTTTANFFTESMLAVVVGGANGATIYVTKTAEMTLNFVSATPSVGDYLVTSTTAGKVTALLDISGNTYMSPEVVAVAVAAGSGSTVRARLLLNSQPIDLFQSVNIFQTLAGTAPPSDFSGTIATLVDADTITYTPTGGNENAMDTAASTDSAKMVLHNTTRGTSATISTVVVGTNTINFVTARPASSQVGDTITIRSQTNTGNLSTAYWVDLDLQSTLSPLARSMLVELNYGDGTTNNRGGMHPYTADNAARRQLVRNTSATVLQWGGQLWIPIINNKICVLWQSGGTAANLVLQLRGVKLAAP